MTDGSEKVGEKAKNLLEIPVGRGRFIKTGIKIAGVVAALGGLGAASVLIGKDSQRLDSAEEIEKTRMADFRSILMKYIDVKWDPSFWKDLESNKYLSTGGRSHLLLLPHKLGNIDSRGVAMGEQGLQKEYCFWLDNTQVSPQEGDVNVIASDIHVATDTYDNEIRSQIVQYYPDASGKFGENPKSGVIDKGDPMPDIDQSDYLNLVNEIKGMETLVNKSLKYPPLEWNYRQLQKQPNQTFSYADYAIIARANVVLPDKTALDYSIWSDKGVAIAFSKVYVPQD